MLNFPCPRILFVAVGMTNAGPAPQINLPGLDGEMKSVGIHVAETELTTCRLAGIRLPHDGLDDAGEVVPVFSELAGNRRLNVENILRAVKISDTEVAVALHWHTDKTRNRILHRLLQFSSTGARSSFHLGLFCRRRGTLLRE